MKDNNIFQFSTQIYGDVVQVNPVYSTARVRIFYKGLNRNYTYITDEFAEKLLSTLPYTPVVGKYQDGDFTDHGNGTEQLQAYGVIPENPNVTWELHEDVDGIMREYACADVLLWTARFPEANEMVGKSQSMELYPNSVVGQWVYDKGQKFFKFEEGAFLGVTALGESTEPCFEGAAFYSYGDSLRQLVEELKTYNLNLNKGGQTEMDEIKDEVLVEEVETVEVAKEAPVVEEAPVTEEVVEEVPATENSIEKTEVEPEVVEEVETEVVEEQPTEDFEKEEDKDEEEKEDEEKEDEEKEDFAKCEDEEDDEEKKEEDEEEKKEEDEEEKKEEDEEDYACGDKKKYSAQISELEAQIVELNSQIATYKSETESMKAELDQLRAFKLGVENAQIEVEKEAVLSKYGKVLPQEVLETYKAKLSEYTSATALNTDLALEFANAQIQAFSLKETQEDVLPSAGFDTEVSCADGAERMLARHLKNK